MSSNPQSVLDVVLNSASVAGRKTYLHQMVYIGEHNFPLQGRENIVNVFERNIRKINEGYHDEALTGFLLAYSTHFAHILEGSEESLLKHATSFVDDNGEENERSNESSTVKKIGRTKVVIVYHHIHQRALSGWTGAPAKPLRTLARIAPQEDPGVHAASCLAKVSRLLQHIRINPAGGMRSLLQATARVAEHLPEVSRLDFLLGAPLLLSLPQYCHHARHFLDHTLFYRENTWPVPCDIVPYSMFKKPEDDAKKIKSQ